MTISAFIEGLPQTGWHLRNGYIRAVFGDQCPISNGTPYRSWQYKAAAKLIGLSTEDAESVAFAADKCIGHDPALRARLLEHCGLKEAGHE